MIMIPVRKSQRLQLLRAAATTLLLILVAAIAVDGAVFTSDARVPSTSLSSVIADLEGDGCNEVTTTCLITSQSVTKSKQRAFVQAVVGDDSQGTTGSKAIGESSLGLAIVTPESHSEISNAASVCQTILYYPDPVDVTRGEGLFDKLAPAIERVAASASPTTPTTLLIVIPDGATAENTKASLERAAEAVLSKLVHAKPVAVLQDIFADVQFVTVSEATEALMTKKGTSSEATERVTAGLLGEIKKSSIDLSPLDLAAARTLGPTARQLLSQTVQQVQQACFGEDEITPKLNPEFGQLCDAAIQQACERLDNVVPRNAGNIASSKFGKQIRADLLSGLESELGVLFEEQLELLQQYSFDDCKKKMSKLLISPNLGSDMKSVANKSFTAFTKAARKLAAKKFSSWTVTAAKSEYRAMLSDFCSNRLQAAQASGQYRPLPRKGVTIGLHWLLPKPFGNDYRQEPWMVHASDNMVYIPKDKITDVSPGEVKAGDWRDKIVPSPAGNDMLYMQ